MSGYIGIDGVARKIKGLYVGVDGVARTVKKAYVGDANGTARLWYQRGTPLGSYAVGKTVKIAVGGKDYDWLVVHQGIPDASIYDASCNGTWLLMKDIYKNRQWHSSGSNDYEGSTIRSYLNGTFYGLLDADVRSTIKQVKIPYRKGNGSSETITSGANGLSTRIFLLSATETSFDHSLMPIGEGAEVAYFKGCANKYADTKRVAYLNGKAEWWWTRSPYLYGYKVMCIMSDGSDYSPKGTESFGIRPCMILPQDALVDDTGHIVAA